MATVRPKCVKCQASVYPSSVQKSGRRPLFANPETWLYQGNYVCDICGVRTIVTFRMAEGDSIAKRPKDLPFRKHPSAQTTKSGAKKKKPRKPRQGGRSTKAGQNYMLDLPGVKPKPKPKPKKKDDGDEDENGGRRRRGKK